MRNLRKVALILALLLMLHCTAFAVDSISMGSEGLTGRRFVVLGDSYTAGYGLSSMSQNWTNLMADEYRMTQFNHSISGSTFASGRNGNYPMVERCLELPPDNNIDFVILQGGSNDWSHSIPMGQDGDRDPETFCGALNLILETLQQKYPGAVIVGFSPWISDGTRNGPGFIQQDYTDTMLRVFAQHGLFCYDASDTAENGMDLDRKTFRETYCLHGGDWYHLSPSGHALFAPIISRWLENTLYPGSRFYDLASVPAYMRSAVLSMVDDGILYGTDTHLFSPTRAVTRAELAQALYRMEGSPDAYQWDLADVDYDAPAYDAVCWCLDEGLFSAGDWFEPDAIVTREMLATVLYRYYTDYCEGFVSTTVGLGTYRDGRDVSSYAKIPFGWSLSSGVLSEQDGMLHPAGAVSRGQLAIALRNLLNYL